MRTFESGATRDNSDNKLDYEGFLSPRVLARFAEYMHDHRVQADGGLRDSDNWQKGMPRAEYVKSLLRHVMEVWTLHREDPLMYGEGHHAELMERALCAVLFNTQGLMHELLAKRDAK